MEHAFESLKKNYTNINEPAKKFLKITRDEYGLCAYVQYRSADPRQKIRGWCCDPKQEIAEWVGVSRPGLYKMIDRLSGQNLLETDAKGNLSVTGYWIDTENNCKLSLQNQEKEKKESVNLVDSDCQLSLHKNGESVNLVTHNIELDIKSKNKDEEKANADLSLKKSIEPIDEAFTPVDALSKKRKNAPGAQKEKKVEALPALDFSKFDNPEKAKEIFTRWLKYRKDIKHPYKSEDTIQTSLKNLFNYSAGRAALAEHIIEKSIGNGYQGFFKPEIQKNGNSTIQPENRFNSAETIASAQRVADSMREYWQ